MQIVIDSWQDPSFFVLSSCSRAMACIFEQDAQGRLADHCSMNERRLIFDQSF